MNATTNFATVPAQGAAVADTYAVGAYFSNLFADLRKMFLPLLRKSHLNTLVLLTNFKQKVSLAVYGRWFRKDHEHFVSEMWFATLRTAFLFNNLVKRY